MILTVHVDDDTTKRLECISHESGRTIVGLAEAAIAEAACSEFRCRNDDPARQPPTRAQRSNSSQTGIQLDAKQQNRLKLPPVRAIEPDFR